MSVLNTRLDFLSDVLQDFCTLHNLEFLSADDLLYDPSNQLTDYQRDWLTAYCSTWDTIAVDAFKSENEQNSLQTGLLTPI